MPNDPAHAYVIFDSFGTVVGLLSLQDSEVKRFEIYAGWKCFLPAQKPEAFRLAAGAASAIASKPPKGP
jgi:hypothetical protein